MRTPNSNLHYVQEAGCKDSFSNKNHLAKMLKLNTGPCKGLHECNPATIA